MPMNSNLNRGEWKQMENNWFKALQEGKTVKVKIELLYRVTDTRPTDLRVLYSFDNGKFNKITFKNSPGGI
nr:MULTISPECIES: DNA/RNA non-specific endonuclease [unclassified Gilliamella]